MSTGDDLDLSEAYAVETPDDNRDLYARWASTYESGFIARHEYVYHQGVAAVFAEAAGPDDAPVLDVGCGTGLVGVALRALGVDAIDGLDLSPEMLDEARTKVDGDGSPVYGDLHVNPDHFESHGFAGRFAADVDAGRITDPDFRRVPTYASGEHAGILSVVAMFRTAG